MKTLITTAFIAAIAATSAFAGPTVFSDGKLLSDAEVSAKYGTGVLVGNYVFENGMFIMGSDSMDSSIVAEYKAAAAARAKASEDKVVEEAAPVLDMEIAVEEVIAETPVVVETPVVETPVVVVETPVVVVETPVVETPVVVVETPVVVVETPVVETPVVPAIPDLNDLEEADVPT